MKRILTGLLAAAFALTLGGIALAAGAGAPATPATPAAPSKMEEKKMDGDSKGAAKKVRKRAPRKAKKAAKKKADGDSKKMDGDTKMEKK